MLLPPSVVVFPCSPPAAGARFLRFSQWICAINFALLGFGFHCSSSGVFFFKSIQLLTNCSLIHGLVVLYVLTV